MKLLLVIIEGQLYLAASLAIFAAEIAFLIWGLWSRRPLIGLLAVFVTVPLIRNTVSAIRSCFFRIPAPEGLLLDKSDGRALYRVVEEIRRAVDAPPLDRIIITKGFDASAVVYSSPWSVRRRRALVLGFPVLTTLSRDELRAVMAHELAHFSGARDAFAAWVYRMRRSWIALRAALDERLATPLYVYWFIRWYVPRLDVASAEVSRRHELMADVVAAKVAGSRAAADALVAFEAGARFTERTHWPAIDISHETDAQPPGPYSRMLAWNARSISPDVLDELLVRETKPADTHPSLRDRFVCLGETERIPPTAVCSAGQEVLGAELGILAGRLDDEWLSHYGKGWSQRRAVYLERRATLDRLAAIETPNSDELFKRAELMEILDGPEAALPTYQAAANQGHPAAGLAAGRVLLDRMDSAGIALVENAMERDDSLVPEACRILADYYAETNQALAARKCEWRATRHRTQARLAQTTSTPRSP